MKAARPARPARPALVRTPVRETRSPSRVPRWLRAILGVPLKTYVVATFFGIIPATFAFAAAGAGLDSVIMAAKAEYAQCVALKAAEACKLRIHASSLVTKELVLALALLGLVALIPIAVRKWRTAHAAAK